MSLLASLPLASSCRTTGSEGADESQFQSQILLPRNPDSPSKLTGKNRSVLVIGGGIAGLTAAYELSSRGYSVALRESASIFGGRLHTRKEKNSSGSFSVEHGLHMWFFQYYNFKRLIGELGLSDNFRPFNEVFFWFEKYKPEVIRSVGPYPANLISIVKDSPNLSLLNAAQTWRALPDLMFYNHGKTPAKLDSMTFPEWAKSTGVSKEFYDIVMYPAASVTLNRPEQLSAAEMALMTHFYFISHPRAFHRAVAKYDHGTALINPWVDKIKSLGAQLTLNSAVKEMKISDEKVNVDGVEYDYVILATDVPGAQKIMQSTVASSNLSSPLNQIKSRIAALKTAPPYHVLRIWFDKPIGKNYPDVKSVIETPESHPINLIGIFHKIEEESRQWAEKSGGSVLEFHLYTTPQFVGKSPEFIWQAIKSNAEKVIPELAEARPLDYSLGGFHNFTSLEVGQLEVRPEVFSAEKLGIRRLFFAGDWVAYKEFPNSLMERSVTTGMVAVNQILYADGVKQLPVEGCSPHGPGIMPVF